MKYAAALLIGATNAAMSPLPMDATAFPVYDTIDAAANSDVTGDEINASYVTDTNLLGGSRGYRNNYFFLPMQKFVQPADYNTAGNVATIVTFSTAGVASFWGILLAKVGGYVAANNGTADATWASGQSAAGEKWMLCPSITSVGSCNGRMYNKTNGATAGKIVEIKDRWITYKTVVKANQKTWTDATKQYQFQFNEDIGIASFYQSSWSSSTAVTDGTAWCSEWKKSLAKDGTEIKHEVVKGYSKKNKCNFVLEVADASTAPTFKISKLDNGTFIFQWIEFLKVDHLGTDGVLATTDSAANYWQGTYASASGPFMNPWSTIGTTADTAKSSTTSWGHYKVPQNWGAGSVGQLRYYNKSGAALDDSTTMTGDIGVFWLMQKKKEAEFNTFKGLVSTFEDAKKKYEDKKKEQETAQADIFAAAVELIKRPEMPNPRPAAYAGPTANLKQYVGSSAVTWKATGTLNKGNAALVTSNTDWNAAPATDNKFANRIGYLIATSDTAAVTVQNTGGVFGRLGQSDMNMPGTIAPVFFGDTTGSLATTILGIYPGDSSDGGVTDAAKKIEITSKAAAWEADLNINPMAGQPAEASGKAVAEGAIALGVTTMAAALVASSLY